MKVSITYDRKVGNMRYSVTIESFSDLPNDGSYDKAIELFECARHAVNDQIQNHKDEIEDTHTQLQETNGHTITVQSPETNKPTQKQLNFIAVMAKELKIDVDYSTIKTSADASTLIEQLSVQRESYRKNQTKK